MSTDAPKRGHRHTRSAAIPASAASSKNPQNPHHLNQHAHAHNSQSEIKDYTSESALQPSTPPRTPRKDKQPSSQNPSSSAMSGTSSKQRPRNKNRLKNVMTSPITTRNDRTTPPFPGVQSAGVPSSAKPMNTPSAAAYAGPTFHASPAPSALPIPSFYSKSVPDSPGAKGLKSLKGAPLSTPPHAAPVANQFQREESPLDFFFKADREEKARAHSANTNQLAGAAGPFQLPFGSLRSSQTPPAASNRTQARQTSGNRMSASGIFAMELDGEAGSPYGPAFSTPYSERINAARNNQPGRHLEQSSPGIQKPLDRSEALKAYLFSGSPLPSPHGEENPHPSSPATLASAGYQSPPALLSGHRSTGLPQRPHVNGHQHGPDSKHQSSSSRAPGRSSGLRQEVTPTKTPTRAHDRVGAYSDSPTPSRMYGDTSLSKNRHLDVNVTQGTSSSPFGDSSGNRNADLQGMEDSLRKILKLDSSPSFGVTKPAAAVSVPNYVGGRPPPLNGMHNGVMGS